MPKNISTPYLRETRICQSHKFIQLTFQILVFKTCNIIDTKQLIQTQTDRMDSSTSSVKLTRSVELNWDDGCPIFASILWLRIGNYVGQQSVAQRVSSSQAVEQQHCMHPLWPGMQQREEGRPPVVGTVRHTSEYNQQTLADRWLAFQSSKVRTQKYYGLCPNVVAGYKMCPKKLFASSEKCRLVTWT